MNGFYNNTLDEVIDDWAKVQKEIDWHVKNRVNKGENYIALYASKSVLAKANFIKFVKEMKALNFHIGFAYDSISKVDAIIAYNKVQPANARIKFMITEYEPYNGVPGGYPEMTALLTAAYPKLKAAGILHGIYMGWPEDNYWETIIKYCDQIFLHCYKKSSSMTETGIWDYCKGRLTVIADKCAKLNKVIQVNIIYSAESLSFGAGNEFAGIWFKTNSWWKAQQLFMSAWDRKASSILKRWVRATGCFIFDTEWAFKSKP
jgi:hypothetical protein